MKIALVMIVRDEARCIQRCLDSARTWVDEMLVLDTGSRDATVAIAQRCGAVVKSFEWIDDFAAARNAALAHTQAAWRFVLDADEWLVAGGEDLATLRDSAPEFLGQIRVDSQIDGAAAHASNWLPRVLPTGVRYAGRVHEQPESALPRRRLALHVAHDGYRDAQRAAKRGRNRSLLERALQEQPDDAYWSYQLGKELEVNSQFAQAQPHYARAYARVPANASWRHDLVVRWMFTLKQLGQVNEALRVASLEQARWGGSPDFFFTLGDVLLESAILQPQRAAELLPQIEASWLRALQIGEQPDLPDTMHGRGSHLAAHNLAVFHSSLGQLDKARHWEQEALRLRHSARAQPEVVG